MTATEIADGLRADILDGRLAPGTELQQGDVAARFGTSRIPVRDALNLLAAEKLVEMRANRTARVVRLTPDALDEVFSLRMMLETDALSRAVPRLTSEAVAGIEQEARRCEVEAGLPTFPEADWRFHRAIYDAADRPFQLALIYDLRRLCQVHIAVYPSLRKKGDRWNADHRHIVAALRSGDADAGVDALSEHLRGAAEALLAAMTASINR